MRTTVGIRETRRLTDAGHKAAAAGASKRKLDKITEAPKGTFPAGVMAGDAEPHRHDPTKSRAVLWTKYTGKKKRLRVHVRELRPKTGRLPFKSDPIVKVKDDFVHFDAFGLRPGARYEYVFLEKSDDGKEKARSPVGYFCTPIAPGALEPVVFGGTSCTFQVGPRLRLTNRNLRHASNQPDLSFFLHGGDQVYCDAPKENPATTLKRFRAKYQKAFSRPGLKALHKAFGMYTTWDDHEVFNGWQGDRDTEGKHDVNKVIRKLNKKKNNIKQIMGWGERSFYEHQPIRRENRESKKLWRKFRWGQTLELFILDCRSERDNKNGMYISAEQEAALIDFLQNPDGAVFKFILNSRPIGYLGKRRPKALSSGDVNEYMDKHKDNPKPKEDYSWTNHTVVAQRERILNAARMTNGVWWLSGDLHYGSIGRVDPGKPKAGEKRVGEIMMGPGGQWTADPTKPKKVKAKKKPFKKVSGKKHISFATLKSNYVVIKVNPGEKDDREKSTLDILFYHRAKRGFKLLHQETRDYAGRVKKPVHSKKNSPNKD